MPWSWEGAGGSGPAADLEALGQNLEHLAALQFLCTAAGEHAGVRNLVQRLIGRVEAHFGEARGKPHLADERLQAVDALERHRKVVFALGVDAPHLARPAGELRGRLGGQVAVKRRVDDGEPHTVIGVGVGAVLVLDHVALEVGYLADLQHAVLGHGGVIDKLAARIEVLVVVRDDAHIADDVFLDGEVDVIGDVGFARSPEIAFHAMRERIEGAAHELRMRHGQRKPRIERRPPRQRADERALHMRLLVGDDPAVVLLGTRAGERDDAAHGDERARHLAVGVLERLDVLVKHRLRGDHLAAVEDRPAADGGRGTFVEDGSCVLENLMLAAHALGLASCWIHREREVFDSAEGKALLREWGLPETLRGVGAIALGYAAGPEGAAAPRKEGYVVRI